MPEKGTCAYKIFGKQYAPFTDGASFIKWVDRRFFMIFMIVAILVAFAYPDAGAKGGDLESKITASWIAVIIIFTLSGWSLKTKELVKAVLYCKLNSVVQVFNLGIIPLIFYGVTSALKLTSMNALLVEGMLIFSCLPTTVSMCVVLTSSANGNNAAAVFNAAFGNCLGIFATPALVLLYVGNKSTVPFEQVLLKLVLKVFVPLCVGQVIQYMGFRDFYVRNKKNFKRVQESCLLFIIYTSFCQTFKTGYAVGGGDIVILIILETFMYVVFCGLILALTGMACFGFNRADRTAILYCGTHKTVAMGIPLLNTMFEGNPDLGLYVVPLLIYHPMQQFVGVFIADRLGPWVLADPNKVPEEEEDSKGRKVPMQLEDVEKSLESGKCTCNSKK